ncbi:MAG: SAM-dependent methyltransferase [Clostridiaceae bacterium]|nr:SAM-dependent methyltransferase [Clostridiaceae bacterium]
MLKLWYETAMDTELNVETIPLREWQDQAKRKHYNRTESTPYQAIDELFEYYQMPHNANFVDFGCGTGRIAFYVHNRFNVPVTGVELNPLTYKDLQKNLKTYNKRDLTSDDRSDYINPQNKIAPINFFLEYAEEFQIQKEHNVFYFFNPFSTPIFEAVINNIKKSLKKHPRQVDIILYYPLYEVQSLLEKQTIFKRLGTLYLDEIYEDEFEKFLVYRYMVD